MPGGVFHRVERPRLPSGRGQVVGEHPVALGVLGHVQPVVLCEQQIRRIGDVAVLPHRFPGGQIH